MTPFEQQQKLIFFPHPLPSKKNIFLTFFWKNVFQLKNWTCSSWHFFLLAIEFNCNWNWTSKSSQKKTPAINIFQILTKKKKIRPEKKISCFFQIFMFKMIKKYFFFFISCFYLVKWPSYFTLCENGYFTKMCTTVHKINFFNFFFKTLKFTI